MQLPDSELAVIELLWSSAPSSAEDLIATLGAARGWQPSTVKTLLARLVKKGALRFERDGRRFLYWPLWEREDYVATASKTFLETLFGGHLTPLVAHLSRQRKLSESDRRALAELLAELEQQHGS
jgi:predicted transcriptional regulator